MRVLGRNIQHCETSGCQSSWQTLAEAKQVNIVKYGRVEKGKNVRTLAQLQQSCQRRQWHPTPVLLSGKSHGRRSLVGCSPWGRQESDTTERLHFHFSLSCIGEGNSNPLQCSCLENPRDRGAWWAAVSGVTQSRTRLKRLSSSSRAARLKPQWKVEKCWEGAKQQPSSTPGNNE